MEGLEGESESIELTLERAQRAIQRAKALTNVFEQASQALEAGAAAAPAPTAQEPATNATATATDASGSGQTMQQLRQFLSAQLSSSQSILGQLQQQQRRADDLVSRLGALRSAHALRAQAARMATGPPAATAEEPATGEQQQQQQEMEQQEELEQQQPGAEDAGPCRQADPMQEDERVARFEALRSAALRMQGASSIPAPQRQHEHEDERSNVSVRPRSPPMHPDSVLVLSDPATTPVGLEPQPGPLQRVAMRLAVLQAQQSNTLQQLINLRLEQLR